MFEAETATLAVPVNECDHIVGPKSVPVTVVNYGDYQCPVLSKNTSVDREDGLVNCWTGCVWFIDIFHSSKTIRVRCVQHPSESLRHNRLHKLTPTALGR